MFIYLFTWLSPRPWDLLAAACSILLVVACESLGLPWCLRGIESACHMQEMQVQDPLEKDLATHFSIPAQEILMDREAWWASVSQKSRTQLSD